MFVLLIHIGISTLSTWLCKSHAWNCLRAPALFLYFSFLSPFSNSASHKHHLTVHAESMLTAVCCALSQRPSDALLLPYTHLQSMWSFSLYLPVRFRFQRNEYLIRTADWMLSSWKYIFLSYKGKNIFRQHIVASQINTMYFIAVMYNSHYLLLLVI